MTSPYPSTPSFTTGLLLAGGMGRRMGGMDKGLQLLRGRPLAAWVLERLTPQVDEILVNANRNEDSYAAFGHRVIGDRVGGYAGPLAGIHSGLIEARHELVACAPCDTPFLPLDVVARLRRALDEEGIDASFAKTGTRSHPVVCLLRKRLAPHLEAFLDDGGRKVEDWYATLRGVAVPFDDQREAFRNINSPEDLAREDLDKAATDPRT